MSIRRAATGTEVIPPGGIVKQEQELELLEGVHVSPENALLRARNASSATSLSRIVGEPGVEGHRSRANRHEERAARGALVATHFFGTFITCSFVEEDVQVRRRAPPRGRAPSPHAARRAAAHSPRSDLVGLPGPRVRSGLASLQPAVLFHPHERRIEGARTELMSVLRQFFEEPRAPDLARCRTMKNVDLPETEPNLAILRG
jgi:hypothetical protein